MLDSNYIQVHLNFFIDKTLQKSGRNDLLYRISVIVRVVYY